MKEMTTLIEEAVTIKFGQLIEQSGDVLLIKRDASNYSDPKKRFMTIMVNTFDAKPSFYHGHYDMNIVDAAISLADRSKDAEMLKNQHRSFFAKTKGALSDFVAFMDDEIEHKTHEGVELSDVIAYDKLIEMPERFLSTKELS